MAEKPFDLAAFLDRAEYCGNLTMWELEFLDDLRGRMLLNGGTWKLSDKQMAVLKRIENKFAPEDLAAE